MSFLSRSEPSRSVDAGPLLSGSIAGYGTSALVGTPEFLDPTPSEPEIPPPAVACHHVDKWFSQFQALDDVSFEVEAGEVAVLIGRSGAGKSTMLRCLNGLERPNGGEVVVHGLPITDDPYVLRALRARVGVVFQQFNLFPQYTVETNVVLAQRLVLNRSSDEAESAAEEALDRVDMLRHRSKLPSQLSGGEQQRVAIARALAMDPVIILLDEPTASVDPELTKGIMELVREIADSSLTVVAVTHEMGFVRAAADRVHFFEDGRLIESGPVEQILDDPEHPSTRRFVADARLLE
ncbi:MAG: amino acid ABC transporter ATP-binding protein [Actinomycetota bacterium]